MHIERRNYFTAKAILTGLVTILFLLMPAAAEDPEAYTVRAVVGEPMQESFKAATAGDFKKAMSFVEQAEAAGDLTNEERSAIAQMKDYIAAKSGGAFGVASAIGAQAKFSSDWFAARYRDVINDEEILRRYNALTDDDIVVIAQAYEILGDYNGCVRYASNQTTSSPTLTKRQLLCAFKANDDSFVRHTIIDNLGTAMSAVHCGSPELAAANMQKANATPDLNIDEKGIVARVQAYIDAKSQQSDAALQPQNLQAGQCSPAIKASNTKPQPSAEP